MKLRDRILLAVLNVAVVALASAGVFLCIDKGHLGRGVQGVKVEGPMEILPPELRSPKFIGATITHVNGHRVGALTELETVNDGFKKGDIVEVTLARQAEYIGTQRVRLLPFYVTGDIIVTALSALLFWGLGLYVLIRRPDDPAALVFHLAMNAATGLIAATPGSFAGQVELRQATQALHLVGQSTLPVLFLHFTFLFPRPRLPQYSRHIWVLYLVGIAIGVAASFAFSAAVAPRLNAGRISDYAGWLEVVQYFFIAGSIASVASFIYAYRGEFEEAERRKLLWVILGASIASLFYVTLFLFPQLALDKTWIPDSATAILAMACPITFTIAIIRYRALDVDMILSRSSAYAIVLGVLALAYGGMLMLTQWVVGRSNIPMSEFPAWLPVLVVALLFEPIRRRVQGFVDRRFFRTRYDLREAERALAANAALCAEPRRLAAVVTAMLDSTLTPEQCFVALVSSGRTTDLLGQSDGAAPLGNEVAIPESQSHGLMAVERWVEPGAHILELPALLASRGIACVAWAQAGAGQHLVLAVGRKKAGTRYSMEDLDLLRESAATAATALERIRLQQDVIRREAEAEHLRELDRLKSFFVSSVSHELKTPLTSIRMFAEMLESGDIEGERVSRYAGVIDSESQRLTRLIDNVLDFSKIERGIKEYRMHELDLGELAEGVMQTMEYQISARGFVARFSRDPGSLLVNADADAIAGAVVNLVTNAIKYSTVNGAIEVGAFRREPYAGISVKDQGIGISPEDVARIFEPFYRTDSGKAIGAAGTGLGLTLVRHALDAHGGSIHVASSPGQGTTFTLLLPLTTSNEDSTSDRG